MAALLAFFSFSFFFSVTQAQDSYTLTGPITLYLEKEKEDGTREFERKTIVPEGQSIRRLPIPLGWIVPRRGGRVVLLDRLPGADNTEAMRLGIEVLFNDGTRLAGLVAERDFRQKTLPIPTLKESPPPPLDSYPISALVTQPSVTPSPPPPSFRREDLLPGLPEPMDLEEKFSHFCNYGGYLTTKGRRQCRSPWNTQRRHLGDLAPLFVRYRVCGPRDVVRCNPLVYGTLREHFGKKSGCLKRPGDTQGHGCCVEILEEGSERRASDVTDSCNRVIFENSVEEVKSFVNQISGNTERLAEHLAMSVVAVGACPRKNAECQDLGEIVHESYGHTSLVLQDREDRGEALAQNIMGLELDLEILNSMAWRLENEALTTRVAGEYSWKKTRESIIHRLITRMGEDERMNNVIRVARENVRCSRLDWSGHCRGRKSPRKSTGVCYRYVKYALLAKGNGFLEEYLPGAYAKEAVRDLARRGYIDIKEYGHTPDDAPHGTIIVYGPHPSSPRAGHIEIVNVEKDMRGNVIRREYISDRLSSTPMTRRAVLGLMIPTGKEERSLLGIEEKGGMVL